MNEYWCRFCFNPREEIRSLIIKRDDHPEIFGTEVWDMKNGNELMLPIYKRYIDHFYRKLTPFEVVLYKMLGYI